MPLERRYNSRAVHFDPDGPAKITGYGAVFDSASEDLGGFTELVAPGAFDDVLGDDVRALFNHDSNIILGRTRSNTLSLEIDDVGLKYSITPPDTQTVRDLVLEPMKRGDISSSSFGFYVESDTWEETDSGIVRTIEKVSQLIDVSPVVYPAYPAADAALRSMDKFKATLGSKDQENPDVDEMMKRAAVMLGVEVIDIPGLVAAIEASQNEIKELRTLVERKQARLSILSRLVA